MEEEEEGYRKTGRLYTTCKRVSRPPSSSPSSHCSSLTRFPTVLASADLSTLTKKGVRDELEAMYGCELGDRKRLVNHTISQHLGL